MCGIAGIYNIARSGSNIENNMHFLKAMTDSLAHRGPDGEGFEILDDGNVFLGHRRLAIIDLSILGRQPMKSLDERFTITFNGEIYNYLDLKAVLSSLGYQFNSKSDTEVILCAYQEWGIECFNKLNGIFSFVIWDNYKKELFMVRDRYGTKPLYYSRIGNQLFFASEYKAIIQHPNYQRKINLKSLKEYLTFQNIFDNGSFLEGIELLPAGTYMHMKSEMKQIPEPITFWNFNFREEKMDASLEECEEELERLFCQAVNRQLVSDVDVGTYLSGGMDSGSITAIATKRYPYMKSFTCGFDLHSASGVELAFDEREKAELMSYFFKTEHYEMVLKSGDMERCMKQLVWHLEDPRVGQSYPNFYAAKLSSQFVKVVLAGTGGDELFAGYPWRYYRAVNNKNFDEYVDQYYEFWQRLLTEEELEGILAPINKQVKDVDCRKIFKDVFKAIDRKEMSPEQCINYSLYLEAKTFLHGLLVVEDKISMAHGLETRVPFLDNDLVDFAMKIPVKYKLNNLAEFVSINENEVGGKKNKYFQKSKDGKTIFRNVMKQHIPEQIAQAEKHGFSAPDASWFRGESIDYVKQIVRNPNAQIYDYLDFKTVNRIVNKHFAGEENKRLFIWSILNIEEWCKQFL